MELLLVLGEQYYSSVIFLSIGSHRKFSHNFLYLCTSVANNIVVVPLGISYYLQHDLQLGCHVAPVIKELLESFELLLLSVFLFFIRTHYPPIRNVKTLQETSSFTCHFVFRRVT